MVNIFLWAFLFLTIIDGQEMDASITIAHFMYPDIDGIPIMLDESGENSFFLDIHYPRALNDYHINYVIVDGAIQMPQGSYFLPQLLPTGMAPDSIHNYSQINYRRGDYNFGELGLALQIEGADSSYFTLQGFKQSPPIMYTSSSWNDNLQNYLVSFKRLSDDVSIAVDVMYHLENYHLPLSTNPVSEYERKTESFHGGFNFKKKVGKLRLDIHPAFQLTNSKRQDALVSYFSLWNRINTKLDLGNHFKIDIQHKLKMIMAEQDNQLIEIETHILRPKIIFNSGIVALEGGGSIYKGLFKPEGKVSLSYKHLYLAAIREFHSYFEPIQIADYTEIEYSLLSLNIGYNSMPFKVLLDIYQVTYLDNNLPGVGWVINIDLGWLRLIEKAGIYDFNSDAVLPVKMYNHLSLIFSPKIWYWRVTPYQPFVGLESLYLQHSDIADIDPTRVPIIEVDTDLESFSSHILNLEFGILINRFKISYRFIQLNSQEDNFSNSNKTFAVQPVQQLVVTWQFWD